MIKLTIVERDDGMVEYLTDVKSVGEADFVIVPTPTGHYRIEARGVGAEPKLTKERFTTVNLAKKALEDYLVVNEAEINKRVLIKKQIERRRNLYDQSES